MRAGAAAAEIVHLGLWLLLLEKLLYSLVWSLLVLSVSLSQCHSHSCHCHRLTTVDSTGLLPVYL